MGDDEFRLPGSGYEEVVKIIRGYGHFNSEVALPQIATVAGVHTTVVSRNNAFLVSLGIIEGGQRKVVTEAGKALSLALDHNMLEDISRNWREIVSRNPAWMSPKLIFVGKHLGHVRNAADHGIDPDVGVSWIIRNATGIEYVFLACSFIAAVTVKELNKPAEI